MKQIRTLADYAADEDERQDKVDAIRQAIRQMTEAERAELIAQHLKDEEAREWFEDGLVIVETEDGLGFHWPDKTVEEVQERGVWLTRILCDPTPLEKRLRARINQ